MTKAFRSEAELVYAKSLKKLSGRLGKLVPELTGEVEMGWTCIEAAMAGEASVHQVNNSRKPETRRS